MPQLRIVLVQSATAIFALHLFLPVVFIPAFYAAGSDRDRSDEFLGVREMPSHPWAELADQFDLFGATVREAGSSIVISADDGAEFSTSASEHHCPLCSYLERVGGPPPEIGLFSSSAGPIGR